MAEIHQLSESTRYLIQGAQTFIKPYKGSVDDLKCLNLGAAIMNLGIGDEVINHLIDQCPESINKALSKRKLTPLMLSTITERISVVKHLCSQKKIQAAARDSLKYNYRHFAAMNADSLKDPIFKDRDFCKDLQKRAGTKFGATYSRLFKLAHSMDKFACEEKTGACSTASKPSYFADVHPDCVGTEKWIDDMVISQKDLVEIWIENRTFYGPQAEEGMQKTTLLELVRKLKERPPALEIKPHEIEGVGCGVYTKEKIFKGDPVFTYLGQFTRAENIDISKNRDYVFSFNNLPKPGRKKEVYDIDGLHYRSPSVMSNHGYSNILPAPTLINKDGLPVQVLFHATNDIEAGEELTWNYGEIYAPNWTYMRELKMDKLIEDIKHRPLELCLMKQSSEDLFDALKPWGHLFSSPNAAINLIHQGHITSRDMKLLNDLQILNLLRTVGYQLSEYSIGAITLYGLIAKFKGDCEKKRDLSFFNKVMEYYLEKFSTIIPPEDVIKVNEIKDKASMIVLGNIFKSTQAFFYLILAQRTRRMEEKTILKDFSNKLDIKVDIVSENAYDNLMKDYVTLINLGRDFLDYTPIDFGL